VRVLVATRSAHKLGEIRRILGGAPGLQLLAPDEAGLPPVPEEEGIEIHETFEENALAKARWFRERTGMTVLADDSGLVVDALGGAPGVRSRRFAPLGHPGEGVDEANNRYLLERLQGVPPVERTARFVCVAVLDAGAGGGPLVVRGEAEGRILDAPAGEGGFGYDPLFFDPELGLTFAELSGEEKDARSHRGKSFSELARRLSGLAERGVS